jgi:hypothetical protein
MALQMKRLSGPENFAVADTAEDLYTVPRNTGYTTTAVIKEIILCNTAASSATVTLWLKPKNVTVGTDHIFINSLTLAANETVTLSTSLVLTNSDNTAGDTYSDKIRGKASTTTVNYMINGYEEY